MTGPGQRVLAQAAAMSASAWYIWYRAAVSKTAKYSGERRSLSACAPNAPAATAMRPDSAPTVTKSRSITSPRRQTLGGQFLRRGSPVSPRRQRSHSDQEYDVTHGHHGHAGRGGTKLRGEIGAEQHGNKYGEPREAQWMPVGTKDGVHRQA